MSLELPDYVLAGMRRNVATIFRALDTVTAAAVANAVKLSPTKLSNLRNNKDDDGRTQIEVFCAILAACALKVVPSSYVAIDPEELRALRLLAAKKCSEEPAPSQFGEL